MLMAGLEVIYENLEQGNRTGPLALEEVELVNRLRIGRLDLADGCKSVNHLLEIGRSFLTTGVMI